MKRKWMVAWLYVVAFGHFAGALAMTWMADAPALASYHQQILSSFGFTAADLDAVELQQWWMGLFGATLQAFSLLLLALIYLGNRYRNPAIWSGLVLVVLWWVPQDIVISLQKDAWSHVWIDVFAVFMLVIPLGLLWNLDRTQNTGIDNER